MNLPAASSGQIGCPESDIEISDEESGAGWKTWKAECAGRTYYCSYHTTGEKSGQYSCRPDASAESPAENSVGIGKEQGTGRTARETPEPGPRSAPPTEAVGFTLTDSLESAQRACVDAGHEWSPAKNASVCSGTPSSVGAEAKARLAFCDDQLCDLTVFLTFEGEASGADAQLKAVVDALHEKYGRPAKNHTGGTAYCRSQGLVRCTASGEGALTQSWEWPTGEKIFLSLRGREGKAVLAIRYVLELPKKAGASAF